MMRSIWGVLLCILLVSCSGTPLYSDLSEQQANDVLAELLRANIDANKSRAPGNDPVWSVAVSGEQFDEAMTVLRAAGLPRQAKQSLAQIFKKEGFVSSALEEKARYISGLEQGFESTIMAIEGVVSASVHIALPERDLLSDEIKPARASVTIIKEVDSKIEQQKANIISIVKNGIEGLENPDNITVIFFNAHQRPTVSARSGFLSSQRSIAIFVAASLAVIGFGVALWMILGARRSAG